MKKLQQRSALLLELIALVVVVVGFAGIASQYQWLKSFDRRLYDGVVTLLGSELPSDVVIVGVDEQSLQRFGRWPWRRPEQARLFRAIALAQPKEVLVDIVYSEPTTTDADIELGSALGDLPELALPMVIDALTDAGQLIEVLPLPQFLDSVTAIGHVHPELDDDGISRGVYLFQGIGQPYWPHLVLAAESKNEDEPQRPSDDCEVPKFSMQNIRCDYRRVPFIGKPGSFDFVSAEGLLAAETQAQEQAKLRGKTVLVGLTATGVSDWVTTPVSGSSRPMPGVEFNANVLAAVRQNTLIRNAKPLSVLLIVLLLAVVPPLVLPRLLPGSMLLVTVAFTLVPILLFYLLLYFARLYVPLGAAAIAAALTYPLWSWRRLEVAWRFVSREVQRFSAERLALGFTVLDNTRLNAVVAHVASVLDAQPRSQILAHEGVDELETEVQLLDENGGSVFRSQISRGARRFELVLERDEPFSQQEQSFVRGVLRDTQVTRGRQNEPIERLNAEIRQLNLLADDVRTIRDVNMKSLEQITSGVCLISMGGLVEYVNSSFTELTQIRVGESILTIGDHVSAPDGMSWENLIYRIVVESDSTSFEVQSATHRMLLDCAPLRVDEELKGYWLMTAADVTEIRMAQRQREEALAFLSHDLRSPMVSILALIRSGGDVKQNKKLLKQIESYALRSLNVSEQFVQLSRVENSEDMDTYEVELSSIANNALEQVFEQGAAKEIRLRFDDQVGDSGLWMKGNGELLERALVNLLTNAVKYSPVNTEVTLRVSLEESGDACCAVIDQGYGIPAVDIDRVFEPYYRSKVREIVVQRGSGLGLRFVKTVVERHGGHVSVVSEPTKGSTFTLRFPASVLIDMEEL